MRRCQTALARDKHAMATPPTTREIRVSAAAVVAGLERNERKRKEEWSHDVGRHRDVGLQRRDEPTAGDDELPDADREHLESQQRDRVLGQSGCLGLNLLHKATA